VNFQIDGGKTNFKIARYSLNDSGLLEVVDMENQFRTYDLHKSLNEYIKFSERTLEKIARKIIENRYVSSEQKREELINRMEEIKKN